MKLHTTLTIVGLSVLMLLNSGCRIITHVQNKRIERGEPYEVIIVPGFPYSADDDKINFVQRLRIFWAYRLWKEGLAKNIIFSGGAVYTPYVESEIMAQYARSLGIPDENIFIESRAEHSTENLFYGYALARELGFKRIAVATDPFQAQLIKRNIRKDTLPVDFIPAEITKIIFKYRGIQPELEDPCLAYEDNFVPLIERISDEERKLGTQGDRFRKRYGMEHVTPAELEKIDFSKAVSNQ